MRFTFNHMTGSKAGVVEEHAAPVISVGRGEGNLLRYDPNQDDKVSAFHARIEVKNGQVFLTDLDSTNGTYLNGNRITGSVPLISGGVVTFGDDGPNVAIQYASGGAVPAASPAGAAPGAAPAAAPAGLAKTEELAVPAEGGPPPPEQKPAASNTTKKVIGVGILGTAAVFLLTCLLSVVLIAANRKVRAAMPSWATRIVQRIPGVNKLMRPPRAPRLPGGIRPPARIPKGARGSQSPQESPQESPQPSEDDGEDEAPPAEPPPDDEE